MADGRKVPYIIEMIADDTTLRNQMKKWNWEDIMGTKGKGFADILGQEGKEAKEKIENALMKLDLDWAKIFGMDKLEAALSRTFKKSRTKIESAITDVDTHKLKTIIEFIEGLGKAFEDMDAKFEAGSAARSLAPLLRTLEQIPETAKRVEAAFGSLSDKLDKSNKPIVITPSFDFAKADKDVEDLKRRLNDLDKKVNIKLDLDDNQVTDKVDEIVYHVGEANDKIKKLQNELDAPETSKEREREVRVELAKQIALRTDYYRTIAKMKSHYGKVVDDFLLGEDDFKGLNLTKEIKNSKDQIKNLIGEISSVSSSTQSNDVRIGVSLPSAEDIRSAVNAEIIKLNKRKDALQSVKIQIDPTGTDIDETTSKATTTDKDDNFIQNINQRFDAISKAIKTRQDEIVTQTKDVWRKEILQQLKFRSSDFEFNFGDALIEGLQTALDEADFKVNIDTEFLANQIKAIFENTNVSLGTGTANINQESMTAAVKAGVRAALFGEQVVATTSSTASAEVVEDTEHIAKETKDVAKRLDIAEDYVKDVVEKIKAIAKYAVKPADKDTPGTKATREIFSRIGLSKDGDGNLIGGLDLVKIKDAGDDNEKIASILETALLSKDDGGQLLGRTVIDALAQFKDSSSKTIPAFLTSLHEVFFMLQEGTQSVEEWTRINKSRTILDDARKKAQDAMALLDVRKTIKKGEAPTIAEIDDLTATMEPYLEQIAKRSLSYSGKKIEELAQEKRKANPSLDFGKSIEEARREIYGQILSSLRTSFTDLKAAREVLGDKTDEASMAEFQSAAESFYKSSTNIFNHLKKQAEDMFKGEIYLQGGKNGHIKKRDINSYKRLASIKDDDVIVDIRVTSSLNNVAIGEAKSEYDEQRLIRGQRADYLVDKTHEEDILRRQLKYKGFNPQGSDKVLVNIEATIEGMQKRIVKANEDIPKLQEQIQLLDKEVELKRQEAQSARAVLEAVRNNPDATETDRRDANLADMKAYGKLYDVISARGVLTRQVDDLRMSQERASNLIEQLKLTKQYNDLLEKSLELEGSIVKLEKDEAPQKEIQKRKRELADIHTQLTEIITTADVFGGLYQQSIGKEYSAAERKTYALEQLKLIDNDLITARAQKSVVGARMSKKDREIAEVDKYGLGAGIGARELGREKNRVTSEFIRSEYVTSLINEARDQTKNAIAKAVNKSELAETNMLREFNDRVANAMIQDGLNPYSDKQTTEFMKTSRGKQYSQDYNKSIETIRGELEKDTRTMWTLYDERVKTIRTQVMTEFKESLKTENGVLRYMSKTKDDVTGEWISEIVEIDVRKALKDRLEEERRILKEQLEGDTKNGKPSIQSEIERLESDRRTAIEYGGVGESEILSADIIKDQIQKEEKLAELQERRATKLQELNDLEKAGLSDDDQSVKQAQKKIANLDKEIARYEMLVRDRQKLVELRWDESKADNYTAEEKELHFTEQIVNYNQKVEDSLVRQENLKEKLGSATEEEKAKLQYQLDQEEAKVEKWRQDISTLEGKIQKIGNERISGIAENATSTSKSDGVLVDLIKKSAGGEGIDDEKLSEIVEVLNNILNVLTGGKVVAGSARSEVAATATKKNSTKKYADDFNFVDALNKQAAEVKKHNQGTKEYILEQAKLYRLLWDYKNNTANLKTLKNDKFLERTEVKSLGLDPALIKAKDRTQAFKDAGGTGKLNAKVSEFIDKFKVAIEGATKEPQKQPVNKQKTDAGIGSIAREDTLSKILEVLNAFKSDGVKVVGKKQAEAKEKTPKTEKTEAELIKERALKDKDAVLGIASSSKIKKKYEQLVKQLEAETDLGKIKTLAQKASALGLNIKKESGEWDYKTADASRVYNIPNANLFGKRRDTVRKSMEKLAREKFNPDGKQYEFLDFDGTKLIYQLTDVRGNVEKVTMEWSELNNQVAITSDRSTSKLDTLASKVQSFGEKFKDAVDAGYLADNDEDLDRFKKKVEEIKTAITDGVSFDDIDKLRNEALRIADEVTKKVNKVKRSYSGTTEMNAATKQHDNLEFSGMLDQEDIGAVKAYNRAYAELLAKHAEFKTAGTLYDEGNQKTLQQMAIKVKTLGKELEVAQTKSEELQQKVANSGLYNGKAIGDISQVAQGTDIYEQMRAKLEELGATNIKVDRIHQRATGTIRHNNKLVSDLEVSYDELTGSLARYHKQERESLTGIPAFLNGFKKKFNSIMQYLSMTMSIHQVIAQLRKGIQYVKEIDLALMELRKVTDETKETYDEFLKIAAKTGARLGTTVSAVTEATATFAKLGYSIKVAAEMAEAAIVYKNVGDNIASTGDAADSIVSTLKGFGMEASDAMSIVDKFNEVGNRFAITSQGIGEALRLSASALNEGKNSLDESIALITAANEVVNDPSSVGTALKTLTLRLRGSKTELEEMGEDVTDMATTTSQLQAKLLALTGGKVNIMLDENTFKNSTQILREMSEAWKSMSDIQRASALELMGGKRQANVLSALIQNFETAEKVIEAAANSAGSALEENEKYLDSIQGKVDQLTNSLQTLWMNTLDSDLVKGVVDLGIEIIKVVDKIGLLTSALIALAAYKGVTALFNAFTSSAIPLRTIWQYINELTIGFKGFTMAQMKANATTAAGHIVNSQYSNGLVRTTLIQWLSKKSTDALEAAKYQLWLAEQGLAAGIATEADVQAAQAAVQAASLSVDYAKLTTVELLGLGFKQLMVSVWGATKAIAAFLFTNPVGWIILAIGAIAGGIAIFNHFHKTTEELTEDLEELKEALQEIQSELDAVNSELEVTNDRMAELLAKDALTFTEKEELDNLKKQNDELQRRLDLLDAEKKLKQDEAAKDFASLMNQRINEDTYNSTGKRNWMDRLADALDTEHKATKWSGDEYLKYLIEEYEKELQKQQDQEGREIDRWTETKANPEKYSKKIRKQLQAWVDAADGIDYGINDETDEWLDYVYNMQDKWAIISNGKNAQTNALNRIFNKDENSDISQAIDKYVEALRKGDISAKTSIENIINNNKKLVEDLEASGLSVNQAVAYFTQFSDADYGTIDGKIKEIDEARTRLANLLSKSVTKDFVGPLTGEYKEFADLFDKNGEVLSDAIAEYFGGEGGGISEQTRVEIEHIVKQVREGKLTVEDALKSFELFGVQSVVDIQVTKVQTNFKDVFSDLEDIDGLVNTFEELGDAINSTLGALDAFNQAQADVADKGFVSIQTALQLMEYTDDYGSVLEVVDGKLQLAKDAEKNLITARIEAIKVSAQTALADAQAAQEKTELAISAYQNAMVEEASASVVATAWEKLVGVAAGIKNVLDNIWSGQNVSELYNAGYNAYLENATGMETVYDDAGLQALKNQLEEDKKATQEALDNYNLSMELSADNLEDVFKSSDKSTTDEVAHDAFQKEMDYWENRIAANQAKYEQVQHEIDMLESQGRKAGVKYYQEQINLENQRLDLLKQQKAEAQKYLDQIATEGNEGSEEWWEVANTINDIEGELDDVTASIVDLNDAMADTHWYMFDEAHDRVSTLTSDLENIRDILSNEELFDDEGNFTKEGLGTLASYVQELGIYEGAMADARKEMELFGDSYDPNKTYVDAYGNDLSIDSEQDWYDAAQKAEEKYDEWNQKVIETRYNIKDLYEQQIDAVEEYTSTLVENYQDYIDVVKEALDSERDLYEFKKSTEQKSKNIASIERRIASLSGSTNAADVAERRKLQAELTDAKRDMDDHYYSHAKDQQSQALDDEATAYETAMNTFIESLYTKLEESTTGLYMSYEEMSTETKSFVDGVTESVVLNAGNVKDTYLVTGETIDDCLMTPWTNAAAAIGTFASSEGALGLMNSWTESKAGAPFYDFQTKVSGYLSKPWSTIIAEGGPVKTFKTSVNSIMSQIVSDVQSNVSDISGVVSNLQTEINKIKDTTIHITTVYETQGDLENYNGGGGNGGGGGDNNSPEKAKTMHADGQLYARTVVPTNLTSTHKTVGGVTYIPIPGTDYYVKKSDAPFGSAPYGTTRYKYYAKGTTGIDKDQLAIVDEFGPELMLRANPTTGRLDYVTKGTSIVPADATSELMKLADIGVDGLMMPKFDSGINMMANYITKPEFNITFDSLVRAENITEETLPAVKKLVTQELNRFTKELNYALKGKGAR